MTQLFKNNSNSALAAGINNSDTSMTVLTGIGSKFPAITGSDYFLLTLTQAGQETSWEIVKVTAVAGDTLSIVRAQEGTTASAWGMGSKAELRLTAGSIDGLVQKELTSEKAAPGKIPISKADGSIDPTWYAALLPNVLFNDIGIPGAAGFGVGICPSLPAGFNPLPGSTDPLSSNYGNYQYTDGSVMCWIPAFYMRLGHAKNPTYAVYGANSISIEPLSAFPTEADANADGYYLHRAFVNAGVNQLGFFRDKYDCSLNGNTASSIQGAMPMVSSPSGSLAVTAIISGTQYTVMTIGTTDYTLIGGTNTVGTRFTATGPGTGTGTVSQQVGFLGATANGQTPANAYHGAIPAARSRGAKFVPQTVFMADALSRLSAAHGQASTSATYCAWYDSTGVKNFPKGNNNNALKDYDDTSVTFTSAGVTAYPAFALTGSGTPFNRTTHNGQACGITDVAGNTRKINPGMTCIAASKNIIGATQTNPVRLTITNHGYTTGRLAMISSMISMTQINNKLYRLTVLDANTVSLDGVDGTAFTAYTSGGLCITGTFYLLKPSVDVAALTNGVTLATDHWGSTGVAAQFDAVELQANTTYPNNVFSQKFGNADNAVFDWSTISGRALTMAGIPLAAGISTAGTKLMGNDLYYQNICDQLCVTSRGDLSYSTGSGSQFRQINYSRNSADYSTGFAAARYL